MTLKSNSYLSELWLLLTLFLIHFLLIYRYIFDLSKKEAEELESIHKSDVINWYRTYLRRSSSKCRRLAVRVWGCDTEPKDAETRPEPEQVIKDITAFKMSSSYYLSICWKRQPFSTRDVNYCVWRIGGSWIWPWGWFFFLPSEPWVRWSDSTLFQATTLGLQKFSCITFDIKHFFKLLIKWTDISYWSQLS